MAKEAAKNVKNAKEIKIKMEKSSDNETKVGKVAKEAAKKRKMENLKKKELKRLPILKPVAVATAEAEGKVFNQCLTTLFIKICYPFIGSHTSLIFT